MMAHFFQPSLLICAWRYLKKARTQLCYVAKSVGKHGGGWKMRVKTCVTLRFFMFTPRQTLFFLSLLSSRILQVGHRCFACRERRSFSFSGAICRRKDSCLSLLIFMVALPKEDPKRGDAFYWAEKKSVVATLFPTPFPFPKKKLNEKSWERKKNKLQAVAWWRHIYYNNFTGLAAFVLVPLFVN